MHDTLQHVVHALADTATIAHTSGEHGGGFNFMHLLDHMKDSRSVESPFGHLSLPQFAPVHLGSTTIDLSMTKHVFFLLLCGMLLLIVMIYVARSYKKSFVPHGFVNLIEMVIVFLRDEVVLPNMGQAGVRYLPYLLTR